MSNSSKFKKRIWTFFALTFVISLNLENYVIKVKFIFFNFIQVGGGRVDFNWRAIWPKKSKSNKNLFEASNALFCTAVRCVDFFIEMDFWFFWNELGFGSNNAWNSDASQTDFETNRRTDRQTERQIDLVLHNIGTKVQFYWQASTNLPPPTHGSIESQKKKIVSFEKKSWKKMSLINRKWNTWQPKISLLIAKK